MTMPSERTRAILGTRAFLQGLVSPETLAGLPTTVPGALQEEARALLRHYPCASAIHLAHHALPQYFGPVMSRRDLSIDPGIELFSWWGFKSGWLIAHDDGVGISAELDGMDVWYWSKDEKSVRRAFSRAYRRAFLRRLLPWLAPPPVVLNGTPAGTTNATTQPSERTRAVFDAKGLLERLLRNRSKTDADDALREYACWLLRHYPLEFEFQLAHQALPQWFGPLPERER